MANCYIDFSCTQQDLQRTDDRTVAEGVSVLYARFDLCPKWAGLKVYARFKFGGAAYDVELADGCALIPWEVVKYTGFEVSVWGEADDGGRLTSRAVYIDVARTISLDTCEPIPSSPTLIQAFTDQAAAAAEAARIAQEANAATVAVGSVATGEAGTEARVVNSGTGMAAVFDFTIPRGEPGEKGEGLPDGGTVGQVMTKTEDGAVWADASGGGGGADIDLPLAIDQGGTNATSAAGARANLDVYSKAEVDALSANSGGSGGGGSVASVELITKAGVIQPYGGDVLPEGFLWCDGAAYSRTAYAELFAAIGTTFGAGDGLTTFNVPDLCGRVPVGTADAYALGDTGGEAEHTLTVDELPANMGTMQALSWHDEVASGFVTRSFKTAPLGSQSGSNIGTATYSFDGGDQPHNNMQPYTVVNYVISTGVSSFTEFVPVANGGTGATTAAGARANLGITELEEMINIRSHYMAVTVSAGFDIGNYETKIPYEKIASEAGDSFTLADNAIVCNFDGVVEVSAIQYVKCDSKGTIQSYVYKNSDSKASIALSDTIAQNFAYPPTILDVSQGDAIYCLIRSWDDSVTAVGHNGAKAKLTVKRIS